jgi:release factor glutamine methyltransferase
MGDQTARHLVSYAQTLLQDSGIDDAMNEARQIAEIAMGLDRGRLTLHLDDPVSAKQEADFHRIVQARADRQPLSQLRGYRDFWGRRFIVTPDVLDPRPETEMLVAEALKYPFQTVLDLGTGSGCILFSLLAERPVATGVGVDVSDAALDVARRNAATLRIESRVRLTQSNWFESIDGTFDLIVSNPPYIAQHEMAGLSPEVALHEPHLALSDHADGLTFYRIITAQASAHLCVQGWLMVEIGPTQGPAVCAMMETAGLSNIEIRHDFDGHDRVVIGQNLQ